MLFAIRCLGAAGVWARLPQNWQEDALAAAADTALEWGRGRTLDHNQPMSVEDASALFLCRFDEFREFGLMLAEDIEAGDIDVNEICRLQWLAAEMGMLGEVFRGHLAGFTGRQGELEDIIARQLKGAHSGGDATKTKADKWRTAPLERAKELRRLHGKWGDARIAKALIEEALLSQDRAETFMRWARRRGGLAPSEVNPAARRPEPQ